MSVGWGRGSAPDAPGATRTCPHCRATILQSASKCPACNGHLRFDAPTSREPLASPLTIEAQLPAPRPGEQWEYSVVVALKDAQGKVLARHVVGVGAMRAEDTRIVALGVELQTVRSSR